MAQLNYNQLQGPAARAFDQACPGTAKAQNSRLVDLALLGPGLVLAGLMGGAPLPAFIRWALIGGGAATVVHNGMEYVSTRELQQQGPPEDGT